MVNDASHYRQVPTVSLDHPGLKNLVAGMLKGSGAYQENNARRSYAPWLKSLLLDCQASGLSYECLSVLTSIPIDTLKKFKAQNTWPEKQELSAKHAHLKEAWDNAGRRHRKTIDHFTLFLSHHYPELSFSRDELRQSLIDLGLRYPRGLKTVDKGAQVKRDFQPHAIWEGDGKLVKVRLNGQLFPFIWYAFVDQSTTLLVGNHMDQSENAETFLRALRDGSANAGTFPIGILIDNRLADGEIGAVQNFCRDHGIVLVKTFPGNSKSNGFAENNFSIFERFVGTIEVAGQSPAEIAQSMAQALVEVFTQQRNHRERMRLGNRTPDEIAEGRQRPEHMRSAIEKLQNRLQKEEKQADTKWQLLQPSFKHFSVISEASQNKMKKLIAVYTINDIIAAQASFLAQIAKYPDRSFGSEYFLAILRNKREEKAKRCYNEAYRASLQLLTILIPTTFNSAELPRKLLNELTEIAGETSPSLLFLRLDSLTWWLTAFSAQNSLPHLWLKIARLAERDRRISDRCWAKVHEYIIEKIGDLIYEPCGRAAPGQSSESEQAEMESLVRTISEIPALCNSH